MRRDAAVKIRSRGMADLCREDHGRMEEAFRTGSAEALPGQMTHMRAAYAQACLCFGTALRVRRVRRAQRQALRPDREVCVRRRL